MARNNGNILTHSYSGKLGTVVLQKDGVMRSLPDVSKRVLSGEQIKHLIRFKQAKEYARRVLADPLLRAQYEEPLRKWKRKKPNIGIYQLAIKDFMKPPKITGVEIERGPRGREVTLIIQATDVIMVAGVSVCILSSSGKILEQGEATERNPQFGFQYLVKDPSLLKKDSILRVSVWDMPGIVTERDVDPALN
ncbi:MAG: hypothetical protein NTW10_03120 [Bacteroidetes bacterium]|nr:hypothetical protein [Bacteroidota bacterium]